MRTIATTQRRASPELLQDNTDYIGAAGIIDAIRKHIPDGSPIYISVDIDVLDLAHTPGTGTPQAGCWTSRELMRKLCGLGDLNIVGADIVEVSSACGHAENTALAGAQVAFKFLTSMVLSKSNTTPGSDLSRKELRLPASSYEHMKAKMAKVPLHEEL